MKRIMLGLGVWCLLAAVSGCSPLSQSLQRQANQGLTYERVSDNPRRYAGETVVWGGYVLENQPGQEQSRLTILTPLWFNKAPKSKGSSRGEFIAVADRYLDPEIYSEDTPVTIGGEVAASTGNGAAGASGSLPVLRVREIHVWKDFYDDRSYQHHPYGPYGPFDPYDDLFGPRFRYFNEPFHPYRYR